jgi:uncharacterized protein YyaL (SSP411 family)
VVLRGEDDGALRAWTAAARTRLRLDDSCFAIAADASALPGLLAERRPQAGAAVTAYVCHGHHCSAPAVSMEAMLAALNP